MAADVDKEISDKESNVRQNGHQTPGSGSWFYRGMWTLLMVFAVPLLAFGFKYYQDAQFLKRHGESVRTLGAEGLFLFSSLDTDHDLFLSPEEFKPIAEKLTGTSFWLFQIVFILSLKFTHLPSVSPAMHSTMLTDNLRLPHRDYTPSGFGGGSDP